MNDLIIEEVSESEFKLSALKGIAAKEIESNKIQVILCEELQSKKEEVFQRIIEDYRKQEFFLFSGFQCIVIN